MMDIDLGNGLSPVGQIIIWNNADLLTKEQISIKVQTFSWKKMPFKSLG